MGETGWPAACTFLKSQLHAYYSSLGMKPTSHVASPLPQHTLTYLSHEVPSASHCCQKRIAGLLITCRWAWREGRSMNAHSEPRDINTRAGKASRNCKWASMQVKKGHCDGHVTLWSQKGIKVRGSFEGSLGSCLSPCGPNPVSHPL